MNDATKRVQISVPAAPERKQQLKMYCARNGISQKEVVDMALARYFEEHKK